MCVIGVVSQNSVTFSYIHQNDNNKTNEAAVKSRDAILNSQVTKLNNLQSFNHNYYKHTTKGKSKREFRGCIVSGGMSRPA